VIGTAIARHSSAVSEKLSPLLFQQSVFLIWAIGLSPVGEPVSTALFLLERFDWLEQWLAVVLRLLDQFQ